MKETKSIKKSRGEKREMIMQGMYQRTIQGGCIGETTVYTRPLPKDTIKARAEKMKVTTETQKLFNDRKSKKWFTYTVAENFTINDYHVTLTFDDEHLPELRAEVMKCLTRYLRRLRAYRKKRGHTVKFIRVIENKHGEGRWHIHLILNAADSRDFEEIRSLWDYGTVVDIERLGKYGDSSMFAENIVTYLTKERLDVEFIGKRLWSGSRNLRKPTVTGGYITSTNPLDIIPIGAEIKEVIEHRNEYSFMTYIKYSLKTPIHNDNKSCNTGGKRSV